MNKDDNKLRLRMRNKSIFMCYNNLGQSVKSIAKLQKLSISSIYRIIKQQYYLETEQTNFLWDLENYLKENCTIRDRTCIYNSLRRYLSMYYIYTYNEIYKLVHDDKKYIRGIGKSYRKILKDFFLSLEK